MRHFAKTWFCLGICLLGIFSVAQADETAGRLDIYFIDVEGGAATLIVTPDNESILIDSGYPDYGDRDRDRILNVLRDVAGLTRINHAVVTHWHLDHYGNHASLAAVVPIDTFWDRGIPDALEEDKKFDERIAGYRAASQNRSQTLRAGDVFDLETDKTSLKVTIVTASRELIENTGQPNPFAREHEPRPEDRSDNAASISFLMEFGNFRFLCCGDLTWNMEAALVTPNNPLGKVDLFMVTHHGLGSSNNPVLVKAIDPVTAVMCNGPTKGGALPTIETLQACESLQHLYQLHRNVKLKLEQQTPPEFIANHGTTEECEGIWVKASVAADGESYTIQIGPEGEARTYAARTAKR